MNIESYENLVVWQKAMDLVIEVYRLAYKLPKWEMYCLSLQMRRAAVSVPSNIAEGSRRGSRKDFRHFLFNAFGSGAELETQIKISKRLFPLTEEDYRNCEGLLQEVMKMLNTFIKKLDS